MILGTHFTSYLGVIFDSNLCFDHQIKKWCFMDVRNTAKVKNILCQADLEVIIHDFISSRLDYGNSLYLGLNHKAVSCML